ncbi:hypothetical protein C0J52_07103 [Blattella germanica]|nr:hypothetical protein C0J52_07103 [Blattella germanica]
MENSSINAKSEITSPIKHKSPTSTIKVRSEFRAPVTNAKTERSKVNPKYYKQAYRIEWESTRDFQGWLKGVPGEPTRAYCTVCEKTLHAHRLSLLKHATTIKHLKAAQKAFALQTNEENSGGTSEEVITDPKVSKVEIVENIVVSDEQMDESDDGAARENDNIVASSSEEIEEDDDQDEGVEEAPDTPKKKTSLDTEMTTPKSTQSTGGPLSTHVLDTAKGNPVAGLPVSLYKLIDGRWTSISEGITNPDGRYNSFIQRPDFTAGRYKLHFDVDRYFELRKLDSLYPFIEIVFDVKSPQDHYHVPLLLSPFGYTTYRGS